ncbi:MAG: ribonuclease E/G [Lachnospiraceae bacterium]|nr:ribonuclease E/G [Lachnospiraceae bacterium]
MIKPKPKNQDGKLLSQSLNEGATLVFCALKEREIGALLCCGKLIRVFASGDGLSLGTVALAKVSEIREDLGSCFLLLKNKQKCYMPLSEFRGETPKCGMTLPVRIKKEPAKGKLATATLNLGEGEADLKELAKTRTEFSILKAGEDYRQKALHYAGEFTSTNHLSLRILCEKEEDRTEISKYMALNTTESAKSDPDLSVSCETYHDSMVSLPVLFGLTGKLDEALSKHVWLKSGAEIVIEPTEAMTVIDVNSAKSSHKSDSEETFLAINEEAAEEILHQILLRNLSGIILIDFINLKGDIKRENFINFFREKARNYDPDFQVLGLTKLGIMECSRRKSGRTLKEEFGL